MRHPANQSKDETPMPKSVSTSEAKSKLSSIIGWVRENRDEVIVESRGEPAAVIMSYAEYEEMQGLKEQRRRRDALERLRAVQRRVSARNRDLTEEQAEELAGEVSRDVIDGLIRKGRL